MSRSQKDDTSHRDERRLPFMRASDTSLNFGWKRKRHHRLSWRCMYDDGFTAKTLSTRCFWTSATRFYGGEPGDDTTAVCVNHVRERCGDEPDDRPAGRNADDLAINDEPVLLHGRQAHCLRRYHFVRLRRNTSESRSRHSIDYIDPEIPPIGESRRASTLSPRA